MDQTEHRSLKKRGGGQGQRYHLHANRPKQINKSKIRRGFAEESAIRGIGVLFFLNQHTHGLESSQF